MDDTFPARSVQDAATEEENKRIEIKRRAEEQLAEFNAQRQREIEERQRANRERQSNSFATPTAATTVKQLNPELSGAQSFGGMELLATAMQNSGGDMRSMLASVLGDPATSASLQQIVNCQASSSMVGFAGPATAPPGIAIRVREAGNDRGTFRRVVLAECSGGQISFSELEKRIIDKFCSSRGVDGVELGKRRLVVLVRLKDQMEVADDEDAAQLVDGDELEATFTAM